MESSNRGGDQILVKGEAASTWQRALEPLKCGCGCSAFRNIQFSGNGVMTLACCECRQSLSISMSAVMAQQVWDQMEREAPETPETCDPIGYRYGGML